MLYGPLLPLRTIPTELHAQSNIRLFGVASQSEPCRISPTHLGIRPILRKRNHISEFFASFSGPVYAVRSLNQPIAQDCFVNLKSFLWRWLGLGLEVRDTVNGRKGVDFHYNKVTGGKSFWHGLRCVNRRSIQFNPLVQQCIAVEEDESANELQTSFPIDPPPKCKTQTIRRLKPTTLKPTNNPNGKGSQLWQRICEKFRRLQSFLGSLTIVNSFTVAWLMVGRHRRPVGYEGGHENSFDYSAQYTAANSMAHHHLYG